MLVIPALADHFENFARCRFPLEPFLHFAEGTHIVDGDDRLRGEGFDQQNLIVGIGVHLIPGQHQASQTFAVLHEGDIQIAAASMCVDNQLEAFVAGFVEVSIAHVQNAARFTAEDRVPDDRIARLHGVFAIGPKLLDIGV